MLRFVERQSLHRVAIFKCKMQAYVRVLTSGKKVLGGKTDEMRAGAVIDGKPDQH